MVLAETGAGFELLFLRYRPGPKCDVKADFGSGLGFHKSPDGLANPSDINTSIACVSFMTLTNWIWTWDVGLCYIYSLTREVNIWVLQSLPHLFLSALYYSYITVTRNLLFCSSSFTCYNFGMTDSLMEDSKNLLILSPWEKRVKWKQLGWNYACFVFSICQNIDSRDSQSVISQ